MKDLLSVTDAIQRLLSAVIPLSSESVTLNDAAGRVSAESVRSGMELPPFDNSAMDGFALRSSDIAGASSDDPVKLEVVADIPAGYNPRVNLQPGQAARIVTGAVMPAGADAMIPVEDTNIGQLIPGSEPPSAVEIYQVVNAGDYIRKRGEDIKSGEMILLPNIRLGPREIGILAMLGIAAVEVYRQPKIGLLSTGDELTPVGVPLEPGQIYETNAYTLSALIHLNGGETLHLGTSKDSKAAVKSLLDQAVDNRVDLILSSAGVSMGAFDFVRTVIEEHGQLDFWRVNMKPGKPLAFGTYKSVPFIGLPGNPVSAYVGYEVFVRPVIEKLAGLPYKPRKSTPVILRESVQSDGRESYLRAIIEEENGKMKARLAGHQGSGNLLSLVRANALIIIPSAVKFLPAGAELEAWFLE